MMSILQKLREKLIVFMTGRNGADELSLGLLILGMVLSILGSLLRFGLLNLLGLIAYGLSIFRMFSRNIAKRRAENARFKGAWYGATTGVRQSVNRVKNARKYKYYKCPQCHSRLRLPRKVGEVTVTCGKCHHTFKQKA